MNPLINMRPQSGIIWILLLLVCAGCSQREYPIDEPREDALLLPRIAGFPQEQAVQLSWGWLSWGGVEADEEETDPTAFRLLMGRESRDELQEIITLPGDQFQHVVSGLTNQQMYFFAVETLRENLSPVRSNVIAVAPSRWIEPKPVFENPTRSRYWGSWAPSGDQIVYASADEREAEGTGIYVYDRNTRSNEYRTSGLQPNWQSSNSRILFVTDLLFNRSVPDTIPSYLGLIEGSGSLSLIVGGDQSFLQPVWSPGGRRIAYLSNPDSGQFHLFQVPLGGSSAATMLTHVFPDLSALERPLDRSPAHPCWLPDGSAIAYDRFVPKGGDPLQHAHDIFSVPLDGSGAEHTLVSSPWEDQIPAFSPDGNSLAYVSDRSGLAGIWVLNLISGKNRQIYGGNEPVVDIKNGRLEWSPNGTQLLFNAWVNDSVTSLFTLQVER